MRKDDDEFTGLIMFVVAITFVVGYLLGSYVTQETGGPGGARRVEEHHTVKESHA